MSGLEEGENLVLVEFHGGGEANKEQREHLLHLQKEAFLLANYYFVFTALIYTTPSIFKFHCQWVPVAFFVLGGFLNLCALSVVAFRYKTILDDIDKNAVMVVCGNPAAKPREESILMRWKRMCRLLSVSMCMALFTGFFVITIIVSWKVSCSENENTHSLPPPL